MKYICCLILFFTLLLPSCQWGRQEAFFPDEGLAERLLRENPDSLAMILEEQVVPSELSDSLRAEYGWWITRLHQRQGRNMVNDSLIHYTLRCYEQQQSPRLTEAYMLAAMQVNYSGDKREEAKEFISKGIQIAANNKDTTLLVELASTLGYHDLLPGNLSLVPEDVKHIIFDYYALDSLQMIHCLYGLGCYYASRQEPDSMEHYMIRALKLAEELRVDNSSILRNYIDGLNAFHQSEKALPLMRKLDQEYPPKHLHDSIVKTATYVCLWLNLGKLDSAEVYLKQLEHCCDLIPRDYYGNGYRTSFFYVEKLLRSVYDVKKNNALNIIAVYDFCEKVASVERRNVAIEKERLFVQNQLERRNLNLKIQKDRNHRLALYILSAAACLIFFLAYLYQRKLLKKERFIRQMREQMRLHQIALSEKEQLIRQNEEAIEQLSARQSEQEEIAEQQLNDQLSEIERIRQENELLNREKKQLQQEMARYAQNIPEKNVEMDSYERMVIQNQALTTSTKQLSLQVILQYKELERLYQGEVHNLSDIDWPVIYKLIDKIFNNYTRRLRASFPLLTEEDIQCCCLIKLQLSTSAIARLYSIAPSSVTKRKQRIKERINQGKNELIGKDQPADVYLWGF